MALIEMLKRKRWRASLGYLFFIGMMATGYYYNLTLVQLGLVDLGTRKLGMPGGQVAGHMALFAVLTCGIAIGMGWGMTRWGWSRSFRVKLRLAFTVVAVQTILTWVVTDIDSLGAYRAWVIAAALSIGAGVPATFGMAVDLVPAEHRAHAAMWITGLAYLAANMLPTEWTIQVFRDQLLWIMAPGAVALGSLALMRFPLVAVWGRQHDSVEFGWARYVREGQRGTLRERPRVILLIALMFAIFFIDSLGFLRLSEVPTYMANTWRSEALGPRLFIGIVHLAGAAIAGVIYSEMDDKILFLWIFGIFAIVHQGYGLHELIAPQSSSTLGVALIYALAVSMYTVVNFTVWADISTPDSIALNAGVGVALSGWTATFLSTGLAIQWRVAGLPLAQHLRRVDALAWLLFLAVLILIFLPQDILKRPEREEPREEGS